MSDPLTIVIISDIVTFVLSLTVSLISFAVKWGQMREAIRNLEATMATKTELNSIGNSLAEIKGMFVLRLKE
jgi:cell division protein FtsL